MDFVSVRQNNLLVICSLVMMTVLVRRRRVIVMRRRSCPADVLVFQLGEEPPPSARLPVPSVQPGRHGRQPVDAGPPERPRLLAEAQDADDEEQDRRRQQPPVAGAGPRLAEGVDGDGDLRHQRHGVARPQLVVLDVVGRDLLLPAEVDEEDGGPQHLQRPRRAAIAAAAAGAAAALSLSLSLALCSGRHGMHIASSELGRV